MLKRLIGEDIDLSWQPGNGLWRTRIDPSQVDQILANLCVNSRDAIQNVGKITIETDNIYLEDSYLLQNPDFKPGDYVVLQVSDNGCGMDKETVANLFEPFFTTKDVGEGTGLGMATVYGIVRQNDGFINVYSEIGSGTTFKIYLPRQDQKQIDFVQKVSEKKILKGDETILLVEDEKAILDTTKMMLERLGYTVLAALSADEALELANEFVPDGIHLLMTDVVMPKMNGRDLSQELIKSYPNLKCLFMSGYTANVIAHHGILDEGLNFINKPYTKQDLSIKLREILAE
jgi:CheY-like chemotaxis protein